MNIRTTQSDIDFERERSAAEDSTAGIPVRKYSDGYLETLAIYRKIADQMLDYDTILFHGSCVSVDGDGYLFTAKSGTGLRSLLDRYVYLSKKREILDFDYIEKECEILGIADFEKESRSLCMKVFGSIDLPVLCESECEMLEYYMFSTTYGTQKQGIQHRLEKSMDPQEQRRNSDIFSEEYSRKLSFTRNFVRLRIVAEF